jgi:hypothetical protein
MVMWDGDAVVEVVVGRRVRRDAKKEAAPAHLTSRRFADSLLTPDLRWNQLHRTTLPNTAAGVARMSGSRRCSHRLIWGSRGSCWEFFESAFRGGRPFAGHLGSLLFGPSSPVLLL